MAGMHIPAHINVKGEPIRTPGTSTMQSRAIAERERVLELMNVPDKIVLAGSDRYIGYNAEPIDTSGIIREDYKPVFHDLPTHLTLADESYPDEPISTEEERTDSSLAIDENPLQELKMMRRQLGRINTRLYKLEDEIEVRRFREKQLFFTTIVGLAAAVISILLRR